MKDYTEKKKIKYEPKFRNPSELTPEQLTDSDYAIKQIEKFSGKGLEVACSRCHHCR